MLGFYSVITYLALGFLGLPIFALGGGPTYIFQPTAGYLYGMGIASFLVAYSAEKLFKESFFKILLTLLSGTLIIFAFGIIHLSVFGKIASTGDPFGISLAIQYGLKPFVLIESLKVLFALFFIYALLKKTKKIN
jgi:biotin transport system substrate-specific component